MVENSPFDLEGGSGSRLDELELEGLEAGLAIKNQPKKIHPKKPTQKNPKNPP
jgi:hypothetical protein